MIPNLSKEIHDGLGGWRELLSRSMSTSMWAACMIALGGTFLAPVIVATTYGANYNAAVLPFQIAIWMIPIAWFSGHFRFSLIASGNQNLEFLACAAGGITTIVSAYFLVRSNGANGATAALVAGGVVNMLLAGYAMFKVIGPIRLSPAAAPIGSCVVAGAIGAVLTMTVDNVAGAMGALIFYALRAASQWNLTRIRHAWEGRLSA
jgi:O-antigen/teichoic acid export membrane protein